MANINAVYSRIFATFKLQPGEVSLIDAVTNINTQYSIYGHATMPIIQGFLAFQRVILFIIGLRS